LPRPQSATRRQRCEDLGSVRDAYTAVTLIALPSAAFGASPVKSAGIDLLWRMRPLRFERADDLAPAPRRPREA
jgi:hypothetical protein